MGYNYLTIHHVIKNFFFLLRIKRTQENNFPFPFFFFSISFLFLFPFPFLSFPFLAFKRSLKVGTLPSHSAAPLLLLLSLPSPPYHISTCLLARFSLLSPVYCFFQIYSFVSASIRRLAFALLPSPSPSSIQVLDNPFTGKLSPFSLDLRLNWRTHIAEGSTPCSAEDEYEDSFIDDDDDLEILPPYPVSTEGAVDKVVNGNKPRNKDRSYKRLKKKYQAVQSDDDTTSWPENIENCNRTVQESASEENFPISSVHKDKRTSNQDLESGRDKATKERVAMDDRMVEGDDTPAKRENGNSDIAASKQEVDTLVIDDQPKR